MFVVYVDPTIVLMTKNKGKVAIIWNSTNSIIQTNKQTNKQTNNTSNT